MIAELLFEGERTILSKKQKIKITKVWNDTDVLVHYQTTFSMHDPVEIVMSHDGRWIEKGGKETQLSNELGSVIEESER